MKDITFVSVIVPHYNDAARLGLLLESLEKQDYPRDCFEIIVVDNGSASTGEVERLSAAHNVRLLHETGSQGSYAARNKGIRAAKGEIFCFTDADCIAGEMWLSEGVKAMEEPGVHLVGGNVIFFFPDRVGAAEYYDSITNMGNETAVYERGVAKTANLFVKKQVFDAIGLFPGQLKSGGDIYFTALAVREGFKLVYSAQAFVSHPARTFLPLIGKAIRVGIGKGSVQKQMKHHQKKPPVRREILDSKRWHAHLNPFDIRRRLKHRGFVVGMFKLSSILIVSYCYLSVMFFAKLVGKLK
ncbi:MAG: glycosyltransferase [bacterium]|nr:glycosyltransferase [bacterium]